MRRSRLLFVGAFAASAVVAACAGVADLDVKYSPVVEGDAGHDGGATGVDADTVDARQNVRPSTIAPSGPEQRDAAPAAPLGSCDAGSGDGDGCDPAAGRGCCFGGGSANCISQSDVAQVCQGAGAVFIACLRGTEDSLCCWSNVPQLAPSGAPLTRTTRAAQYGTDCGAPGGGIACLENADCPNRDCKTRPCNGSSFGKITIGQCGVEPACP